MGSPVRYNLKGLGFILLFYVFNVNEASAPVEFSPKTNSYITTKADNSGLLDPTPFVDGSQALASGGRTPIEKTHTRPRPVIQSKRLRGPVFRDGYSTGLVDQVPNFNAGDVKPPSPPSESSPLTQSSIPRESIGSPSSNKRQRPFIGPGYIDAGDRGRRNEQSFQPDNPPVQAPPLRPSNFPGQKPPSIQQSNRQGRISSFKPPNLPGQAAQSFPPRRGILPGKLDLPDPRGNGPPRDLLPQPPPSGSKVDRIGRISPPVSSSRPSNLFRGNPSNSQDINRPRNLSPNPPNFRDNNRPRNLSPNPPKFQDSHRPLDLSPNPPNFQDNNRPRDLSPNPPNFQDNNRPRDLSPNPPNYQDNNRPRDLPPYQNKPYDQPSRTSFQPTNSSFNSPNPGSLNPFPNDPNTGLSKPDPSQFPNPFKFSDTLAGGDFPFPSTSTFNRRSPRPRPSRTFQPSNFFNEFKNPLDTYTPGAQRKRQDPAPTQRYPIQPTAIYRNNNNNDNFNNNNNNNNNNIYNNNGYNNGNFNNNKNNGFNNNNNNNNNNQYNYNSDPRFDARRALGARDTPVYNNNNNNNNNNNVYGDGTQCFQYSFPAEAYRMSDLAKSYPEAEIQKEIDMHPYLSPLVGVAAKAVNNDPFTFNAPISSQFDFSGFGFKDDATTSDKYNHLKNEKAFPGNMQAGDFVGRYPPSMQPLDSACPSRETTLRSFFYHSGDCYVVNPDFQQITFHRCSRQDCNFCGVNRGLSACVEEYRWVTVVAYCNALTANKRISPMRLLMPVGCSCQHFVC